MSVRNLLFLLLFPLSACAERSVDVDPLIDLCADAPPRIVIDDESCTGEDIDRGRCIVGDAEVALDEFSDFDVVNVTGSLLVHANGFDIELRQLRSVGGCLAVSGGDGDARAARFPSLVEAGRVVLAEDNLSDVDLSALRRGDVVVEEANLFQLALTAHREGNIEVRQAKGLNSLLANTLTGAVVVDGAELLTALALPALEDAADIFIGTTGLTGLSLPSLQQAGRFVVVDNGAMRSLDAPQLRGIESVLRVVGNDIDDDDVCALVDLVQFDADVDVTVDVTCP